MAKTSYINLTPELESAYYSCLQPGDRYTFSRVRRKNVLLSKKSKKGISQRSLLSEISLAWSGLSEAQKTSWSDAGAECNLNGWRLFVQDYCARRVNGLPGLATPSLSHQCWVGQIHIEDPATEAKIVQIHPHYYYVYKKVLGKKSMYSPVKVVEDLSIPFRIEGKFYPDLVACGDDPFVKFYALIWYSYQGVNLFKEVSSIIPLSGGWYGAAAEILDIDTIVIRYDLFIHLHDVRGDLYFDNIQALHSGQNWARDPFCKDIDQGFTRNYYQIPKHWSAEILPEGADFESVYKDF